MTKPIDKLYDTRVLPSGQLFVVQIYYGEKIGWSAVKLFNTEKEAKTWATGGIKSTPRKQ